MQCQARYPVMKQHFPLKRKIEFSGTSYWMFSSESQEWETTPWNHSYIIPLPSSPCNLSWTTSLTTCSPKRPVPLTAAGLRFRTWVHAAASPVRRGEQLAQWSSFFQKLTLTLQPCFLIPPTWHTNRGWQLEVKYQICPSSVFYSVQCFLWPGFGDSITLWKPYLAHISHQVPQMLLWKKIPKNRKTVIWRQEYELQKLWISLLGRDNKNFTLFWAS